MEKLNDVVTWLCRQTGWRMDILRWHSSCYTWHRAVKMTEYRNHKLNFLIIVMSTAMSYLLFRQYANVNLDENVIFLSLIIFALWLSLKCWQTLYFTGLIQPLYTANMNHWWRCSDVTVGHVNTMASVCSEAKSRVRWCLSISSLPADLSHIHRRWRAARSAAGRVPTASDSTRLMRHDI